MSRTTTQSKKIRDNEKYIINEVSKGIMKGFTVSYMLNEISESLGVQTNSLDNIWYRSNWKSKLSEEHRKLISPRNRFTNKAETEKIADKPKVSAAKKIYTLVKQTNADMSHLQELYNIQGEELKLQLKKGFKKIEDNQNSFAQSVSHKLSKMMQINQPVEVLNTPARFEVDYKSDVKVLQAPLQLKYDENKVNALIDEHEKLEGELKNEKYLRMTNEDLYDELKNEFNKMREQLTETKKELDNTKNSLSIKEQKIDAHKKVKSQLEHENSLLTQLNDQLKSKNETLANKNKLLNKRGLVDRLLNRDVEFDTVVN